MNRIDLKIARLLIKYLNTYINKVNLSRSPITKEDQWNYLTANKKKILFKLDENLEIILHTDSILSRLIYLGFEQYEISFIKKFLKQGDTFIDIGANIGLFTLIASQIIGEKGKILAFEPTPEIYKRLIENIDLNGLQNIETYNLGLSDRKALLSFNVSKDGYDAWNSFALNERLNSSETIDIMADTLDSIIKRKNIYIVNLIKIDVEGWEKFVLQGAKDLLEKDNSPTLLVEFTETNAFSAGYYLGELFDFVQSFGYDWYSFDAKSNTFTKQIKKLHYLDENLIATKNISDCYTRISNDI